MFVSPVSLHQEMVLKATLRLCLSAGFGVVRDMQEFTSSPEETIFFQVGGFDRCLNQISSVYTET